MIISTVAVPKYHNHSASPFSAMVGRGPSEVLSGAARLFAVQWRDSPKDEGKVDG